MNSTLFERLTLLWHDSGLFRVNLVLLILGLLFLAV